MKGSNDRIYELIEIHSTEEYNLVIELFEEYAMDIEIDLSFQNFEVELKEIKTHYSRPDGILIIVQQHAQLSLGCFGIRKLTDEICELKRMYIKKEARGKGLGNIMMIHALQLGQELNYLQMRLDTLPTMSAAINLYEKYGFYEIEAYRYNPIEGTKYFEVDLNN